MSSNDSNLYTVNKAKLLEILKANREKHLTNYKAAVVAFKEKAQQELTRQLDNIKEGRKFDLTFALPRPVNYTKQYDKIIGIFELSNETERKITEQEYTQYVLDEWNWQATFYANSMSYLSKDVGSSMDYDSDSLV